MEMSLPVDVPEGESVSPAILLFPRWAETCLKVLLVYSVGTYVLEIDLVRTPNSIAGPGFWLWSERCAAAIFTLEYFFRWRAAGSRYPLSGLGVVDLIAILPFWAGFFVPHTWLGAIRTLRVLRLLKLYRYSRATRSFVAGLQRAWRRLFGMGIVVMILVLFSAAGIYELENDVQPQTFGTLGNTLWWTVVTLLSVGYGDAVPVTPLGKVFASFIMLSGTGIMAAFIGIVGVSVYQEVTGREEEGSK